jgi:hypothetical protein
MFRIYSSRNVTFILHRATGTALLVYFVLHVLTISTALLSGPQAFTSVMAAFRHPPSRGGGGHRRLHRLPRHQWARDDRRRARLVGSADGDRPHALALATHHGARWCCRWSCSTWCCSTGSSAADAAFDAVSAAGEGRA